MTRAPTVLADLVPLNKGLSRADRLLLTGFEGESKAWVEGGKIHFMAKCTGAYGTAQSDYLVLEHPNPTKKFTLAVKIDTQDASGNIVIRCSVKHTGSNDLSLRDLGSLWYEVIGPKTREEYGCASATVRKVGLFGFADPFDFFKGLNCLVHRSGDLPPFFGRLVDTDGSSVIVEAPDGTYQEFKPVFFDDYLKVNREESKESTVIAMDFLPGKMKSLWSGAEGEFMDTTVAEAKHDSGIYYATVEIK